MRAKRSLGQNFLKDITIVERIISLADLKMNDTVLEIGPGKGILTGMLAEYAQLVIAIEKDDALFPYLKNKFKDHNNIRLIHGDILEYDLSILLQNNFKIVANLPYNIASQFIIRLVSYAQHLTAVVVMVQKEVAERICAQVGQSNYSALSTIVSAAFNATPGFVIAPESFSPQPKVYSQVIKLIPKSSPIPVSDIENFKKLIFHTFSQRRKMIRNTLISLPFMTPELLVELAEKVDIVLNKRPQDLSAEDYYRISQEYEHQVAKIKKSGDNK